MLTVWLGTAQDIFMDVISAIRLSHLAHKRLTNFVIKVILLYLFKVYKV